MSEIIIGPPQLNQIVIQEEEKSVVVESSISAVATIIAQGPQGPPGGGGIIVDEAAKVDKSVVYYDAVAASFKVDATWTTSTLTDGGNF
jgi:hypothetical protein